MHSAVLLGAPVLNHVLDPILEGPPTSEILTVLGEAAFEEALERGRAMTFEQAVAYALSEDGAPDRERL